MDVVHWTPEFFIGCALNIALLVGIVLLIRWAVRRFVLHAMDVHDARQRRRYGPHRMR